MRKTITAIIPALLFIILVSVGASAQDTEKKESPKTTTIDAWREALPGGDQPTVDAPTTVTKAPKENVEETPDQIERRILILERNLMEALKLRDSAALKRFLADDFILAGINIGETGAPQPDKARYIDWAVKNLELKSYNVEKTTVRVFPSMAVVTVNYKRQASVAGAPSDGDFIVTDVWIKRGNRWQAVSHHISQSPKAQ